MMRTLLAAGLDEARVRAWMVARPAAAAGYAEDLARFGQFWRLERELRAMLPRKPQRTPAQQEAAAALLEAARESRRQFSAAHIAEVYNRLTDHMRKFVRVERLIYDAAALVPGLCPSEAEVEAERAGKQGDKDGVEIDQGILCHAVLARADTGTHLCHAMLLPRADSLERFAAYDRDGKADLDFATVERRGKASYVTLRNPRYLNAEDAATMAPMEIAVDLALLDPQTQVCVLRGDYVEHPKYRGRRIFNAGINLTHLYYGKIDYIWYLWRDLGWVNKAMRGLARADIGPDEASGDTKEKVWISQVDTFAIGGGCQVLLVCDYNIAAADSYMTLPARKEGIIPGMANLRLPRFVGDRIARQAIMYEKRLDCDSPEGRMIIDKLAPSQDIEAAVEEAVQGLTSSGMVSARSNRVAFRVGLEPLDTFRRYAAVYAREQALCHFSPALIANLERHWNAQNRKV